jgi:hypothetical protein
MADGPAPYQYFVVAVIGPVGLILGETVVAAGKSGQWVVIEVESVAG